MKREGEKKEGKIRNKKEMLGVGRGERGRGCRKNGGGRENIKEQKREEKNERG